MSCASSSSKRKEKKRKEKQNPYKIRTIKENKIKIVSVQSIP